MGVLIAVWVVVGAGLLYYLFFAGKSKPSAPEERPPSLAVTGWGGVFVESGEGEVVLCVLPSAQADARDRITDETPPGTIAAVVFIPAADVGGYLWASTVLDALSVSADVPVYSTSDDAIERWPDGGEHDTTREVERLPGKITIGTATLRRRSDSAVDVEWDIGERTERAHIGVALHFGLEQPYPNVVVGSMAAGDSGAPSSEALAALRQVNLLKNVPPGNIDDNAQLWVELGIGVTVFSDEEQVDTSWVEAAAQLVEVARASDNDHQALENAVKEAGVLANVNVLMALSAGGELELAATIAETAADVYADHGDIWFQCGVVSFMAGQTTDASEHYKRAVAAATPEPRALCNLAAIQADAGDLDGAVEFAKRALVELPNDPVVVQTAVVVLARSGDIDGATEMLALNASSLERTVRVGLEVALERGSEAFEESVSHSFPGHAELMVSAGHELVEGGDLEGAISVLRRAIELQPSHLGAAAELGLALSGLERDNEAIEAYTIAIESVAGGELLRFNRGNAARRTGELDDAVADYRRCIELVPDWVDAHVNLISALQMKGDISDASAELDVLSKLEVPAELLEELRGNLDEARS